MDFFLYSAFICIDKYKIEGQEKRRFKASQFSWFFNFEMFNLVAIKSSLYFNLSDLCNIDCDRALNADSNPFMKHLHTWISHVLSILYIRFSWCEIIEEFQRSWWITDWPNCMRQSAARQTRGVTFHHVGILIYSFSNAIYVRGTLLSNCLYLLNLSRVILLFKIYYRSSISSRSK